MTSEQLLFRLTDMCDIYFEKSLISKESIVKKYADFFVSTISSDGHSVSVALHTGSVCFEIVSIIVAALACLSLDTTDAETVIDSLKEGDMVLFRNERYHWRGVDFKDGNKYIVLDQDGRGKNGKTTIWVLFDINKNLIKPYYGNSGVTDGRGIRRKNSNRVDFISHILGIEAMDVSSVTGVSVVIVIDRHIFERLSKGLCIVYGNGKSIGLLDLVTASYYTDSGEEYQFGNNPAKTEPVMKITGKVSTARDLVLDKNGNRVVGLMVIGAKNVSKGGSELVDLFGRKSLKFAHVALGIESECAEDIIISQEDATIFACTKEFLLRNSLPSKEKNKLTLELDKQVDNIINTTLIIELVYGGCSWEEFRKARESLNMIRKSEWNEDDKNSFLISAYSLLNLFTTAVFPIQRLEKAVENGKLMGGVSSPHLRIRELWELAYKAESIDSHCAYVADIIERLYKSTFSESLKFNALKRHLEFSSGKKIAIVVPKTYYTEILCEDKTIYRKGITIVTANRFDNSIFYDEIIAVGDFSGKGFNPLKCKSAPNVFVLLFECETWGFKHKKHKVEIFEKRLNSRCRVTSDDIFDVEDLEDNDVKFKDLGAFVDAGGDLEKYIDNISTFYISRFASGIQGNAGSNLLSEVYAIGRFVSGEQILFSKYYNGVVFDTAKGTVSEINAEDLSAGDQLVFAKRDDHTKNMVDYIYENLQSNGRLSADVLDATEKAAYWKEALREYKVVYNLSYKEISKELRKLGSSLQEVSIRQWLIEESHIVGPRDESTLRQIAELTQDPYLLRDTHSYFEACRLVRRQRKEILELIGKAITDKLSGHKPPIGSVLGIVYDDVENLSETLELEAITLLETPITVPTNLINKPIMDWGVWHDN